jgi:hypothetical protein
MLVENLNGRLGWVGVKGFCGWDRGELLLLLNMELLLILRSLVGVFGIWKIGECMGRVFLVDGGQVPSGLCGPHPV